METERKYDAPFIKDPIIFKAVAFVRKMIEQGDSDFFAVCKSAKFYSVDRAELAYELLRYKDYVVNGDEWRKGRKGNAKPVEETDCRADFI